MCGFRRPAEQEEKQKEGEEGGRLGTGGEETYWSRQLEWLAVMSSPSATSLASASPSSAHTPAKLITRCASLYTCVARSRSRNSVASANTASARLSDCQGAEEGGENPKV